MSMHEDNMGTNYEQEQEQMETHTHTPDVSFRRIMSSMDVTKPGVSVADRCVINAVDEPAKCEQAHS